MELVIILGSIAAQLAMMALTTGLLILRWTRLDGEHITDSGYGGERPLAIFGAIILGLGWPLTLPYLLAMNSVDKRLVTEKKTEQEEAMQVSQELKEWLKVAKNAKDATEREIAQSMIDKLKPSSK